MGRLNPDERYKQLLESAVAIAEENGFNQMTHALVATKSSVSKATVFKYFETISKLRDEVMRVAISRELLPVIAAGVVSRNEVALVAPESLKEKSLASVL